MATTTTPALEDPRSPREPHKLRSRRTSRAGRPNFELYSWLFMRFSGVLLTFLVLGHLLIMLVLDGGIEKIDFAFVAGRWASPFWQVWDLLTLWLATLHGTNGLRTVINDYAERDASRFTLKTLLYTASIVMVFLGSLVIFTFTPHIKA
ncbi:MAG TPA: succinate dehydrogenase, hydrophobic membrane anchor protein [Actinospica sp.]|nr:succinate dehydrogenase, hydrophobic membrane anchor protein [Actinospica sp.]